MHPKFFRGGSCRHDRSKIASRLPDEAWIKYFNKNNDVVLSINIEFQCRRDDYKQNKETDII